MLKIKSGAGAARIYGLRPEMVFASIIIEQVFLDHGKDAVVTAGCDGTHKTGSAHYAGNALDFRLNDIDAKLHALILAEVKVALGEDFDVLLEGTGTPNVHLHVEFQPKKAIGA